MLPVKQPFMEVECYRSYIDDLYSSNMEKCMEAIVCLKNSVIGSNRQKSSVLSQGVVPRLMQLLGDCSVPVQMKTEATVTLGSLAKGTDQHVQSLIELGIVPLLLSGVTSSDQKYTEATLRCLSTIFQSPNAPVSLIFMDSIIVPCLLNLTTQSVTCQVCVPAILAAACKTPEQQGFLIQEGAVPVLAQLLCSTQSLVQMNALTCLASLCYQNPTVAACVAQARCLEIHEPCFVDKSMPDLLFMLMAQDRPSDMQLAAARCITFLHRAGAFSADDPKILYRTLPCLVRLCKKDRPPLQRAQAAETLAYLTEVDIELQRTASISNHLVPTLSDLLKHPVVHIGSRAPAAIVEQEIKTSTEMRQAAFRAFASLGANDEDIRKKIIETDNLMDHIVTGLQDPSPKVRLAAIRCLHSLSRSVQQLRTTFQDHSVWRPLMQLLQGASDDILTVASSTLCNLLLEFSPSKEPILESGAVDMLCDLTRRKDPALRLNGIWALMNMAFQAEQKIKSQILNTLGTDQMFRLLSDSEVDVLMKTLGLLRNLLSTKSHIDYIMNLHGIQIMQAVVLILEGNHSAEVKEQALCILANIGDGDSAKEFIMSNEDVLKKLQDYMAHSNVKLQVAAIFCISNLVWREESGAVDRQARLKEMGVYKQLQQLIMTTDTLLFDKVKTAMTQFSEA
ncbi:Armadillo repeat-containing protein 8 [Frankliniella fusca]|uniref:Armadillo repeat-containing protein 8 n=1 Tax=Frankliniella fusca TaxID=407009 RepID=A0AAE1HJT3_9NEOP|nr:Armadillo repeat-containing protein 8 [Frankliniella fusca]